MESEPTLGQLLANLTDAVAEYQGVVNRMFAIHSDRIDLCDRMVTELRDDTHEDLLALSNRIEANTPAVTATMDAIFRCLPDESGGVRDADA